MKFAAYYFPILLFLAAIFFVLYHVPNNNARCYLQNKGLTIICTMDGQQIMGQVTK
jgi:hypothetical protein